MRAGSNGIRQLNTYSEQGVLVGLAVTIAVGVLVSDANTTAIH